ncbi:MAG: DinB family protein [Abditibacteriaceae bacterium]
MESIEVLIGMAEWGAQNVVYNLDFIPDDKLQWRPAPEAQSALEIAHEIARSVDSASILFQTGEMTRRVTEPQNRDEAKEAILDAVETYAATLRSLTEEQLNSTVIFPFREMPMQFAMRVPVTEILHHHGQIAYIQLLLGDTENHFFQLDKDV